MIFHLRTIWIACLIVFAPMGAATAQERHALVVGINTYENLTSLQKAVNDGRAMADSLERAGFTVDSGFDLGRREFVQLLARFLGRLEPDDEALVFYAGHAVAIENRNFLVPSDASALEQSSEALIIAESIGQDFLLEQITATGVRLTVVIMDACRDNPFEGLSTRSAGRDAGLAITQPPRGVFMLYSADEGQSALDGLGPEDTHENSVFTRTLLPLIEEPGIDIVDIARRLRGDVQALAASVQHQQFPVYRDRMQGEGRFIVSPAALVAEPPAEEESVPQALIETALTPCANARADWSLIGETPSLALLEAFREAHSGCPLMMALAAERLAALNAPEPVPAETVASPPAAETDTEDAVNVAASVQECVALSHPDNVDWETFTTGAPLSNARLACDAALHALRGTTGPDYFHVTALSGRIESALGHEDAAYELYREAAEGGDGVGAYNFAVLHEQGRGTAVNGDIATRWYRRAGEFGRSSGWYKYGYLHYTGDIVPQDYDRARQGFQAAADGGDALSMYYLGAMHQRGEGVEANDTLAAEWFLRGAEAGDRYSMYHLANAYLNGRGVPRDEAEAARWYRHSSDAGLSPARARLGLMYLDGVGVQQSADTALQLLASAADDGSTFAMRNLGILYYDDDRIRNDYDEAVRWFRRGAEADDAASAVELAFMYFNGQGVGRDVDQAARYFLQAAEGGDLRGMRNAALFYRNGTSFRRDQDAATLWFLTAADAGDAPSMAYLGWQYQSGRGVQRSSGEAAYWFMRSLASGDDLIIRNPNDFTEAAGRELQRLLRDAGHYNGALDGAVGTGTIAAMQAYHDANN